MIALANIFETLNPIVHGIWVFIMVAGFLAYGGKNAVYVIGMIIGGTILACFLMIVLGSAFGSIHPSLVPVGVIAAYAILGYLMWKIKLKLFPVKNDNRKDS